MAKRKTCSVNWFKWKFTLKYTNYSQFNRVLLYVVVLAFQEVPFNYFPIISVIIFFVPQTNVQHFCPFKLFKILFTFFSRIIEKNTPRNIWRVSFDTNLPCLELVQYSKKPEFECMIHTAWYSAKFLQNISSSKSKFGYQKKKKNKYGMFMIARCPSI